MAVDENDTRAEILTALRGAGCHACAVENGATHPGTPDVYWARGLYGGWIEVKWISHWPKRDIVVLVPKFRKDQRLWLRAHDRVGATCHVVIQVDRDRLLLPGAWAAEHLGHVTQGALRSAALSIWCGPQECDRLLPRALIP